MRGLARKSPTSAPARGNPRSAREETIYDRHAVGLYRQALLTLDDDQNLAEQVVAEVIIAECTRPEAPDSDVSAVDRRLAVSTYRRCQELSLSSAQHRHRGGRPRASAANRPEPGRPGPTVLSARERGVLALVLFGGLGYAQASDELAISPGDLAAMLHAALRTLAAAADTPLGAAGT